MKQMLLFVGEKKSSRGHVCRCRPKFLLNPPTAQPVSDLQLRAGPTPPPVRRICACTMATPYGKLKDGTEVLKVSISSGDMKCDVLTLGATIASLEVPDANGATADGAATVVTCEFDQVYVFFCFLLGAGRQVG